MDVIKPGAEPATDGISAAEYPSGSAARTIVKVLALLDTHGIAYCIPHGWQGLPTQWGSDVDVIVSRSTSSADLLRLFDAEADRIGAKAVRARGGFITFGCVTPEGLPQFVNFDFTHDYFAGNILIASGETLLADRRRSGNFWIPSPAAGFAAGFARAVLRDKLDAAAAEQLSLLHVQAPDAARRMLDTYLPPQKSEAITQAAASNDWSSIIGGRKEWRAEVKRKLLRDNFASCASHWMKEQAGKLNRVIHPQGFHVALLGPDGAGKSSTIAALETAMAPLFSRTEVKGFAPTLRQILRRRQGSTSTPHALKPRSLPTSLLRAGWWTAFALMSHVSLRWDKTRSTLILNDRHFIDILVDPVRYRYGGPRWLLKVIARLMPRPDAIILLHGPAEVLQARKKELTVEETARQCRDYLALVSRLPRSHVIDATQPFGAVVAEATRIVLAKERHDQSR